MNTNVLAQRPSVRAGAPPGAVISGGSRAVVKGGKSSLLRAYTDDPGLKVTPVQVLVASLLFIGFVTTLHIMGKLLSFTTRK